MASSTCCSTTLLDAACTRPWNWFVGITSAWEIELVFDEQKTHQDPRRASKPAHRSETPLGVLQELYALSLGHFAVRAMMAEAAAHRAVGPGPVVVHGLLADFEMSDAGMHGRRHRQICRCGTKCCCGR